MADPELVEELRRRGATEEQIADLGDSDLIGLSGDLSLAADMVLTLDELAERAGTTPDRARRMFHALGLEPDELAGFGEADVAAVQMIESDESGIVEQVADELLRVAGTSLRRLAEASVAVYVQDIENHVDRDRTDLLQLAEMNSLASQLLVEFSEALGAMFRHHMWVAVRHQRSTQRDVAAPQLARVAVGFVDLVGYTPISRTLGPGELTRYVDAFERRAFEVAHAHGGRVVKSIGDEVMFTAPELDAVAAIALELVTSFGDDPSTRPRGGISAGEVMFRLGDLYGPVVNTAARLVDAAAPGQVLTDLAAPAGDRTARTPEGRRDLKGFDRPVEVWSVGTVAN